MNFSTLEVLEAINRGRRSNIRGIALSGFDFSQISFAHCPRFIDCDLRFCKFNNAYMLDYLFKGCDMRYCEFRRSRWGYCNFDNCDLRGSVFDTIYDRPVWFKNCNLECTTWLHVDCSDIRLDGTENRLTGVMGWNGRNIGGAFDPWEDGN